MDIKGLVLKVCAVVAFALFSLQSTAATLTLNFDQEFSGGADPLGGTPWLTALFDDDGTAGSVTLTLTSGLVDNEFFSGIYLNFDDTQDVTALSFALVSGDAASSINLQKNKYKADGDGKYDILLSFPTSGNRFGAGETVIYDITLAGIVASDFNFLSKPSGGNGPFTGAAHVQGIGTAGDSGWIAPNPVPVPAAVWLFGSGLLGLVGVARRKRA